MLKSSTAHLDQQPGSSTAHAGSQNSLQETTACFDKAIQTAQELHFEMSNLKALGTYLN